MQAGGRQAWKENVPKCSHPPWVSVHMQVFHGGRGMELGSRGWGKAKGMSKGVPSPPRG